jgi:hypothetical protein
LTALVTVIGARAGSIFEERRIAITQRGIADSLYASVEADVLKGKRHLGCPNQPGRLSNRIYLCGASELADFGE